MSCQLNTEANLKELPPTFCSQKVHVYLLIQNSSSPSPRISLIFNITNLKYEIAVEIQGRLFVIRPHKIKRKVMLPKDNGAEQKLRRENQGKEGRNETKIRLKLIRYENKPCSSMLTSKEHAGMA